MSSSLAHTKALWYLTRGTGLVSLLLLTLSVVLGVTQSVRWAHPRWPRFLTSGLHKNVSLLVVAFLAIHIGTAVIDGFAPIGWLDVVIPFKSAYRPIWLGMGTLAFDLLVALVVTSLLRLRLGYRAWRAIHWTSYACWPVALVHGLGTGSDPRHAWALGLQLLCLGAVAAAVIWRLADGWSGQDASLRLLGAMWGSVVVAVILAFTWIGPLRPGWARRAGTPVALLAGKTASSAGGSAQSPSSVAGAGANGTASPSTTVAPGGRAAGFSVPFTASLSGSLNRKQVTGNQESVTITATLPEAGNATLRMVLQGLPLSGGGVEMQSSQASLGPSDNPALYRGQIVSLAGERIRLLLEDGSGHQITVSVTLQIDENSGAVSGTATAAARSAGSDGGGGGDDG